MKFPSLTFYTDRLPNDVGGRTNGPIVRIRPLYLADVGIHKHEYEHVKQFWSVGLVAAVLLALVDLSLTLGGFAAHPLLYKFCRKYRLVCEVSAYKVQMQFANASGARLSLDGAAQRLMSPRYDLRLFRDLAVALLR